MCAWIRTYGFLHISSQSSCLSNGNANIGARISMLRALRDRMYRNPAFDATPSKINTGVAHSTNISPCHPHSMNIQIVKDTPQSREHHSHRVLGLCITIIHGFNNAWLQSLDTWHRVPIVTLVEPHNETRLHESRMQTLLVAPPKALGTPKPVQAPRTWRLQRFRYRD